MKIYAKIHEAKQEIGKVSKNKTNPHFKNTYADLNALIEAVEPILLEKGLILLQPIKEGKVFTQIIDVDNGEMIESFIELTPNLTSQALGSQITYYRRYQISSILLLMADDDDGQLASKPQPKQLPICSELLFDKAVARYEGLELDVFDKLIKAYTLTPKQILEINEITNK
jgi:hypothetical protein